MVKSDSERVREALGGATDKPLVGADVWTCPALAPLGPGGPRCPAGSLSHVEPGEYAQARLTQALHVPLSELSNGVEPDGVNKGMTTYLHCAAGIRVHPAADILRSMGFERVVPLQEGFAQLAQSGRFPFEIPKE